MRHTLIFFILSTLLVVSCAPIPYYLEVEKRQDSEVKIDFTDKTISIISICNSSKGDSAYLSQMAIGMAEQIEKDRGLTTGSVNVFFIPDSIYRMTGLPFLYDVAKNTSSDYLILADSLKVGEYEMGSDTNQQVAFEDSFFIQAVVLLPFNLHYSIFDAHTMIPLYEKSVSDSISWVLLDEEPIPYLKAIAKANASSDKGFNSLGSDLGKDLSTQWNSQKKMIIYYDSRSWMSALEYAQSFQWEKAVDIWMELTNSNDPIKVSCAAYNIAVACQINGQIDLAKKWLDFAQKKYEFREIESLREELNNN